MHSHFHPDPWLNAGILSPLRSLSLASILVVLRLLAQYLLFNPGEIKIIFKDIEGLECLCVDALQKEVWDRLWSRESI
jgi:hypothetical protein